MEAFECECADAELPQIFSRESVGVKGEAAGCSGAGGRGLVGAAEERGYRGHLEVESTLGQCWGLVEK